MDDDLGTFLTELDDIDQLAQLNVMGIGKKSKGNKKQNEYSGLGIDQRGVISTHPKSKTLIDFSRDQGREAPVNFMPVVGRKPYDKSMYRVDNIESKKMMKGLTQEEVNQMEKEKTRQFIAADLLKTEMRPKIKTGHTAMMGPSRDDHFYTRFLFKKPELFVTKQQEQLANQQAIEKDLSKRYPKPVIKGGWRSKDTTRDTHFYTKFVYKKEQQNKKQKLRPISRSKSSMGHNRPDLKFEYLPPYSTCVFDKTRAKIDHGLNQGDALDWKKIVPRKSPSVIHHDLDYEVKHVDPHVSSVSFKRMNGRDKRVIHRPISEFSYTPGEYEVTESRSKAVEAKIKGGKWDSKVRARPKAKESYTALHGYDRIMKRLLERKRREKRQQEKQRLARKRQMFIEQEIRRNKQHAEAYG